MIPSHLANDGNLETCFVTLKEDAWWHLELGAHVRVSVVFILHRSFVNLERFDVLVGECVLSKSFCVFCLLINLWFVVIIDQYHVFRIH